MTQTFYKKDNKKRKITFEKIKKLEYFIEITVCLLQTHSHGFKEEQKRKVSKCAVEPVLDLFSEGE